MRRVLAAVFEPIGRTAPACCVSASLIVVVMAGPTALEVALVLGVAVIAAQCVRCRLWLRQFRYGPLEGVTWLTITPL